MTQTYDIVGVRRLADALDMLAEDLPIDRAMSKDQARQLMALGQSLGAAASQLRQLAAQPVRADAAPPLTEVFAAIAAARGASATAGSIGQVITLAGDVAVLALVVALQKWPLAGPALAALQTHLAAFEP